MANHKTGFSRTSMVGLLWLIGSLGYSLPCHAGVSGMDALIVSSQPVQVSAYDLIYGEGTACTLLPDQGLYQCDPTGTKPVRVQIESSQPVRLGLQPDAITVVANKNFSEEAARTIVDEMQKGTHRQKEVPERARKPLLELPSRAALTETPGLKLDNEEPRHDSTLDDDTTWWLISPDREEHLPEAKEISEHLGDPLASRQNLELEFEEIPDPSEKRVPLCPPGTLAVILRPASSDDAPGQNETEIKQEIKEEPEPETTTTSSDDIENSQSLVQPESFGAAGSSSVFVVCDGETVTIKQEPVDEQNYPETATNYSPMEDDSQNEPGVYKECDECGEEYCFSASTHTCLSDKTPCSRRPCQPPSEKHQRTHSGEKPFQCDHEGCTYSTTTRGSLKTHQRTHSGEKPFQCDHEGCTYSTTQSCSLKRHQRTHSGDKPKQKKRKLEKQGDELEDQQNSP